MGQAVVEVEAGGQKRPAGQTSAHCGPFCAWTYQK
jgi:hypothetical protein